MASAIGLDIGTSAVRAVQLAAGGRRAPKLERLGQVMLTPGAVRDGEIVDPDAVVASIRALWSQWGFKGKNVALGLANQQVVVRQVDLPYAPEDELRESLPFQVQEYIPIPLDQATLDFQVIEHFENAEGQRFSRVLVIAAQSDMVNTVLGVVERAKLRPAMLDLDAFALLRSLASERVVNGGGGEMLIDIGASVTNVVVHENGVPRFVRVLLMGGGGLTDGLTTSLGMSHEEAEQTKAQIGIAPPGAPVPNDEAARIISERADRFVEEIRGSFDYYAAQAESVPLQRVILTGGGSQLANLRERLSAVLRLPVDTGHALQQLEIGKVGLDEAQLAQAEPFLAVAVGLALGAAR